MSSEQLLFLSSAVPHLLPCQLEGQSNSIDTFISDPDPSCSVADRSWAVGFVTTSVCQVRSLVEATRTLRRQRPEDSSLLTPKTWRKPWPYSVVMLHLFLSPKSRTLPSLFYAIQFSRRIRGNPRQQRHISFRMGTPERHPPGHPPTRPCINLHEEFLHRNVRILGHRCTSRPTSATTQSSWPPCKDVCAFLGTAGTM